MSSGGEGGGGRGDTKLSVSGRPGLISYSRYMLAITMVVNP